MISEDFHNKNSWLPGSIKLQQTKHITNNGIKINLFKFERIPNNLYLFSKL